MTNPAGRLVTLIASPKDEPVSYFKGVVQQTQGSKALVLVDGGISMWCDAMDVKAFENDRVRVEVRNRKATLIANYTRPVTDDSKAQQAIDIATVAANAVDDAQRAADAAIEYAEAAQVSASEAATAAQGAQRDAASAQTAAQNAQRDASAANAAARGAIAGLGTLESVIDTVNWFASHKKASTDTTVNPDKTYYIYDESTGTLSAVDPEGTENPSSEGWWELDETIQNYVATHVAETDDGLYVLSTAAGWRVLVSTGVGDYVAGVFIIDPQGVIRQALTGAGITFSESMPFTIGGTSAFIQFDGNGHISIGGAGVSIAGGVTIGGTNRTLAQTLVAVEYGVGSSPTSHSDITSWSSSTPTWSDGSYVWQRTTNANGTYTYTCIQGAKGEDGKSVYVKSSSKTGDVTTVVLTDGTTDTTLTITDGTDGQNGTPGLNGYVHTAWATSEDGTEGFSTTVSAGKTYLGVCTNNTEADPTTPSSYSWSLIKGAKGDKGDTPTITATKSGGTTTIKVDGTTIATVEDGTDGTTPTVTTRTNQDGSTTIVINGSDSATIENGTDGKSYYTYIRYSENSNGSGMVATPTASTKYIGVYTGQSSSVPAYTSFTWSKYVGENGTSPDPLTVTGTAVDYQLSESGTTKPTGNWSETPLAPTTTQYLWTRTTITFSDGSDAVTYSVGGKVGQKGDTGPEAVVTVYPTAIDWGANTATLAVSLRVNGTITTPTSYKWTKGTSATSLGTAATLAVTDLNETYHCTVTW